MTKLNHFFHCCKFCNQIFVVVVSMHENFKSSLFIFLPNLSVHFVFIQFRYRFCLSLELKFSIASCSLSVNKKDFFFRLWEQFDFCSENSIEKHLYFPVLRYKKQIAIDFLVDKAELDSKLTADLHEQRTVCSFSRMFKMSQNLV